MTPVHSIHIPTTLLRGSDLQTTPWVIDASALVVEEEEVRRVVFDTIDDELAAVGDQAALMRSNIGVWSRLTAERLKEIVARVISVVTSGTWLAARADDAAERVRCSYYISSMEAVNDVSRLLRTIESGVTERLPGLEQWKELSAWMANLEASLVRQLRALTESAAAVRPASAFYEARWTKSWKDDVMHPSADEIAGYENEVAKIASLDEGETRLGALHTALDFETEEIGRNPWGDDYLNLRTDAKALVKAFSLKRGNEQGEALDDLRLHARKYEWLTAEIAKLEPRAGDDDGMQPTFANCHFEAVNFNDIHDNFAARRANH